MDFINRLRALVRKDEGQDLLVSTVFTNIAGAIPAGV